MVIGKILFLSFFFIICINGFSQQTTLRQIDSAIQKAASQRADKKTFVKTCFYIADEYMNIEQYDSSQLWLNEIHQLLPLKNNSLDNYFLLTRQAEVYYYNNLQQLGLQESRRGLLMAEALKDSILLADSYNFLGLFYMNIDSAARSVAFYKKGLLYTKQPPNPPQYLSLSKPHHLHGNLGEAYLKLGQYDSALYHNYISLEKATEIKWDRGMAVGYASLGDVYMAIAKADSALTNYTKGVAVAIPALDLDVALICYSGMAQAHYQLNQAGEMRRSLDSGFSLLHTNPNINRFYALVFLNTAIDIYRRKSQSSDLVKAMELKLTIEKSNIDGNNKQIQTILNAGMENEKHILSLQVEEAERKQELANTRLMLAMIGITFLVIGFLVYRYFQNQKIAVSKIRQKISQDLHDDIGASLSSLQIYGTIAEQSLSSNPDKAIEMVNKISSQSKEIMENMNDIVWSMKSGGSSNTSFEIKIKNYASGLLADGNIAFTYDIMPNADAVITGITARKNILLIAKEAMNNIAKYSKAKMAGLSLYTENKDLIMIIEDDGIGFDAGAAVGNGLENMEQRTKELSGIFFIETALGKGTKIKTVFPLQSIN